jgi:NADPH:quinone reductase-like Zn-dependent oxidoreductase
MHFLRWLSWTGFQLDIGAFNYKTGPRYHGASEEVLAIPKANPSYDVQPVNSAAWIPSEKARLEVDYAPMPKCGDEELILKNHAVAVNPIDWKIQSSGDLGFGFGYPMILGEDVAGEVFEVGSNLKDRFHVGQRVMAHTMGLNKGSAYGGFQLYPVSIAATTSPIPEDMSFSEAAVLPLSISTAAAGLFMNATLGLDYPDADLSCSEPFTNEKDLPVLLVWGGSSSVGSTVIQLASAAGYAVITTASPSHFEYCKGLGAAHVLDYHSPDIAASLISLMRGRKVVGSYDAIGSVDTVRQCASVLHALGGGKVASVGFAPGDLFPDVTIASIGSGEIDTQEPEVAKNIWGQYVPSALKSRRLVPRPEAFIVGVGKGLGDVQAGLDKQKQGVSARKVVVVLRYE